MRLEIVKAPAGILQRPTRPVENIDGKFIKTTEKMFRVMHSANGVGLAANQIGLGKSFFIYQFKDARGIVINPVLNEVSLETVKGNEGCLSIPGKTFEIERPKVIWVTALDLDGNEIHYELKDFLARMFMHELDHLSGKLINETI